MLVGLGLHMERRPAVGLWIKSEPAEAADAPGTETRAAMAPWTDGGLNVQARGAARRATGDGGTDREAGRGVDRPGRCR